GCGGGRRPGSWRRNVTVRAVGKQGDDYAAIAASGELERDLLRASRRRARAVPREKPLVADEPLGHVPAEVRRDAELAVELGLLVDARDDARGHVLEAFQAVQRLGGLHRDHLYGAVARLEAPPRAHDGAAGPDADHRMGDAPFRLVPDLARSAELVRPGIRLVRVLIDVKPLLRLILHQLAGEPDGSVGLLQGIAEDDPRAEVPSDPLARFAHVA